MQPFFPLQRTEELSSQSRTAVKDSSWDSNPGSLTPGSCSFFEAQRATRVSLKARRRPSLKLSSPWHLVGVQSFWNDRESMGLPLPLLQCSRARLSWAMFLLLVKCAPLSVKNRSNSSEPCLPRHSKQNVPISLSTAQEGRGGQWSGEEPSHQTRSFYVVEFRVERTPNR